MDDVCFDEIRSKEELRVRNRVVGEHIDVDYGSISKFFDDRGSNQKLSHKYNYVLFQDENPQLAIQRDQQEKDKICKLLKPMKDQRVLDIGCGIGRWGERMCEDGLYYVGIDGSSALIARAEDNLKNYSNKRLFVGKVQDFLGILQEAGEDSFDFIFVNGVFMYLNDADFEQALHDIRTIGESNVQIYIKDSMGIKERLTLDQIYSDGLKQNYSAIYRSVFEYQQMTERIFGEEFQLVSEGELFGDSLHNRRETTDYFMIWKKI